MSNTHLSRWPTWENNDPSRDTGSPPTPWRWLIFLPLKPGAMSNVAVKKASDLLQFDRGSFLTACLLVSCELFDLAA